MGQRRCHRGRRLRRVGEGATLVRQQAAAQRGTRASGLAGGAAAGPRAWAARQRVLCCAGAGPLQGGGASCAAAAAAGLQRVLPPPCLLWCRYALWLDADLASGLSRNSTTFGNDSLAGSQEFRVGAVELWGLS